MNRITYVLGIILALLVAAPFSQHTAFGAECSGDQILRMLNAGFSREEVIQICGQDSVETQAIQDMTTYRVVTDSNVRRSPTTASPVVTTLGRGSEVTVLSRTPSNEPGSDTVWYRVAIDGKEIGYISGNLIEPIGRR